MSLIKDLVGESAKGLTFYEYCRKNIVLDDGSEYDPFKRACMVEIFEAYDSHPYVVILKGAQTGFSTLAIAHSLFMVDVKGRNIIYYLPTDKMAEGFGPTRFDPYIDRSEYLKSRLMGTDQGTLKQIGTNFLYVKGLYGKSGAISTPADEIKFDEVALIDPENMELAQDRISAPGSLGWQKYFSVPLFEEDGIDEQYQLSDMRVWHIKCEKCGSEWVAEDEFPDNIVKRDGEWMMVCLKCGRPLDVNNGRWIPQHPEREDIRGYRVPQLIIPGVKLHLIMNRWKKAKDKPSKRAIFNRSVLGMPDSGDMQPVNSEALKRVEEASDYFFYDYSDQMTGVGIDMGDKAHVAIASEYGLEGVQYKAFFEVDVDDLEEFVKNIEDLYNVGALVIDAMPYKKTAKDVVRCLKRAPGYIQYFSGTDLAEGTEGEDDRQVMKVTVDRTQSLDETTDLFACNPPMALLPKTRTTPEERIMNQVKSHLKKLVKEKIGDDKIQYKKKVENHFGMAANSARIALILAKGSDKGCGPVEYESVKEGRFGKRRGAY